MSITNAEFKKAFREVVSLEFSHVPIDENSIRYTFSQKFNKRMEKLIKSQKKVYWSFVNTTSKRIAIILLTIFAMFTATFSVKAIREPIVNFIKQVYETFTYYSFNGDRTNTITKEYNITQIPSKFKLIDKLKNNNSIIATYESSSKDTIVFSQMVTKTNSGIFFDNENTSIKKVMVDGIEIELQEWYDTKTAVWTYDGFFFMLDCEGDIDFDMIKQIIKYVK